MMHFVKHHPWGIVCHTFLSLAAPSVAPGNLTGSNKTSVDSIDVTFGTIPLKYIHGYLKGYKIEYRVHRIGLAYDQDAVTQSVMVGPFVHEVCVICSQDVFT